MLKGSLILLQHFIMSPISTISSQLTQYVAKLVQKMSSFKTTTVIWTNQSSVGGMKNGDIIFVSQSQKKVVKKWP